ncbi:hypothetical protein P171DRAFT_431323 [Karstenula rhodostoma CBS 690.94]|uniref:Uncharacterized protein n=1 Tax=Karstenula rhodostoma CBS 690.94 TaxID=1392251 RepID=A0A9P4PNA8_9PLEO|nr:hypothetical protein P171DRAFT_431323 [Karstenula rhodostoma CBS 690.94]
MTSKATAIRRSCRVVRVQAFSTENVYGGMAIALRTLLLTLRLDRVQDRHYVSMGTPLYSQSFEDQDRRFQGRFSVANRTCLIILGVYAKVSGLLYISIRCRSSPASPLQISVAVADADQITYTVGNRLSLALLSNCARRNCGPRGSARTARNSSAAPVQPSNTGTATP